MESTGGYGPLNERSSRSGETKYRRVAKKLQIFEIMILYLSSLRYKIYFLSKGEKIIMGKQSFQHEGHYVCKCGREFIKSQSYNAHLSHCKVYLGDERYQKRKNDVNKNFKVGLQVKIKNDYLIKLCKYINIITTIKQWSLEIHYCENCGKELPKNLIEVFGSGRFCSRECANSKKHSNITKQKISNSVKNYVDNNQEYVKETTKKSGITRSINSIKQKNTKLVKIGKSSDELDITYEELEQYRETHNVCEICGKPETCITYTGANLRDKPNKLCIDHNHITKQFRGLLCVSCNSKLGWFEHNKDAILSYLELKGYE